jgi:cytochrome c556
VNSVNRKFEPALWSGPKDADRQAGGIYGEVPDKEILAHLDRHSKAVMKDFYRTSDFCGACHKAALPSMLNGYKWQRAIFLS